MIPNTSIAPSHSAGESVRQTCSVQEILLQSHLIKTQFRSHYARTLLRKADEGAETTHLVGGKACVGMTDSKPGITSFIGSVGELWSSYEAVGSAPTSDTISGHSTQVTELHVSYSVDMVTARSNLEF